MQKGAWGKSAKYEKPIHHQRERKKTCERWKSRTQDTQNSNYIFTPRTENVIKSSAEEKGQSSFLSVSVQSVHCIKMNENV